MPRALRGLIFIGTSGWSYEAWREEFYERRPARHAIEFRHPSWFCDEVADCLREHRIALCQSHAADWRNAPRNALRLIRLTQA